MFACSKSRMETPERYMKYVQVNNKDNSGLVDVVPVSLLLTLAGFAFCSSVFIVDFEQVNADKRRLRTYFSTLAEFIFCKVSVGS